MKRLHFILSHSIFIAVCAVAMCFQTTTILHLQTNNWLLGFVFFATLCSYNSYWLFSNKIFGSVFYQQIFFKKERFKVVLLAVYFTALFICYFQTSLSINLLLPAIILNVLYIVPLLPFKVLRFTRRIGVLKTIVLAFTWMYVTGFLPMQQPILSLTGFEIALLVNRFLFMLLLCLVFDNRDITVDKIKGLHSIATDMKPAAVKFLVLLLFILLVGSVYMLQYLGLDLGQGFALLISAIATGYIFYLSFQKRSYFFYYFFVDGMMLFSALATYVASI
jgi:hypothetical protein